MFEHSSISIGLAFSPNILLMDDTISVPSIESKPSSTKSVFGLRGTPLCT